MRRLQIDIDNCDDCPYLEENNGFFCTHAESLQGPHGGSRELPQDIPTWVIPAFCPLPVVEPDRATLTCECCDEEAHSETIFVESVRFNEVEGIPDAWLQGLSPAERKSISETDEERLERILEEEGIDVLEAVAYEPLEDTLHGTK